MPQNESIKRQLIKTINNAQ